MSYYRFDTLSDEESDGIELEFGESCVEPKISPYVSSRANGKYITPMHLPAWS